MLLFASCGPSVERPVHVAPTTEVTPLPQEGTLEEQSILSWLVKQGVKKVGKEQLKEALEKSIREPLRKFAADKEAKEILQEADKLFSVLNPDPSAVDLIGFVPMVGDVFDAVKFAQSSAQFKDAFKKLDVLHKRAKSYLAKRKPAPADAILKLMNGYESRILFVGTKKYSVTAERMRHILRRHHPKYWDGSFSKDKEGNYKQTFLPDHMTPEQI